MSQTPSPREETLEKIQEFNVSDSFENWNYSIANNNYQSPSNLNKIKELTDINVGDLCHDLENKCKISRIIDKNGAPNECSERTRSN